MTRRDKRLLYRAAALNLWRWGGDPGNEFEAVRAAQELNLDPDDPELSGVRLANLLRGEGATEILEGLRRANHLPSPQPE